MYGTFDYRWARPNEVTECLGTVTAGERFFNTPNGWREVVWVRHVDTTPTAPTLPEASARARWRFDLFGAMLLLRATPPPVPRPPRMRAETRPLAPLVGMTAQLGRRRVRRRWRKTKAMRRADR